MGGSQSHSGGGDGDGAGTGETQSSMGNPGMLSNRFGVVPIETLLKEKISVNDKMSAAATMTNIGYQAPTIDGPYDPETVASSFMNTMTERKQWKMAWQSVADAVKFVKPDAGDVQIKHVVNNIRRDLLPKDGTLPKYTPETTNLIANKLVVYGPHGADGEFRKLHSARVLNFQATGQLGDVGSKIGVSGVNLHGRTGPDNEFVQQLYSQFSQTAKTYGSDDRVKRAITRPFHQISARGSRKHQPQGPMYFRPSIRDFAVTSTGKSNRVTGLMNQAGYDNVLQNDNYLIRSQTKPSTSIQDHLGDKGYGLYKFLVEGAQKNLPTELFAD